MWKMPKKSNQLLVSEIEDLEDDLTKTLFKQVEKAVDVHHACLLLLEKGFINEYEVKKKAIIENFDEQYKIPTIRTMSIYSYLSAKWYTSEDSIRKIIRERNK